MSWPSRDEELVRSPIIDGLLGPSPSGHRPRPDSVDDTGRRRGRVTTLTGTFEKQGTCPGCLKAARRTRSFSGSDMEDLERQADAWGEEPTGHRKCGW